MPTDETQGKSGEIPPTPPPAPSLPANSPVPPPPAAAPGQPPVPPAAQPAKPAVVRRSVPRGAMISRDPAMKRFLDDMKKLAFEENASPDAILKWLKAMPKKPGDPPKFPTPPTINRWIELERPKYAGRAKAGVIREQIGEEIRTLTSIRAAQDRVGISNINPFDQREAWTAMFRLLSLQWEYDSLVVDHQMDDKWQAQKNKNAEMLIKILENTAKFNEGFAFYELTARYAWEDLLRYGMPDMIQRAMMRAGMPMAESNKLLNALVIESEFTDFDKFVADAQARVAGIQKRREQVPVDPKMDVVVEQPPQKLIGGA